MGSSSSQKWPRTAHLLGLLIVSWCVMLMTHELGHIFGGWLSGARLKDYDLRPWRLPYSIHDPDPHPLVTLWSGPIFGALAPLAAALVFRRAWTRLIAHFCILANGAYLAAAWFSGDQYLDTTRMLEKGSHPFWLVLFCLVTIPVGYVGLRNACIEIVNPRAAKADTA